MASAKRKAPVTTKKPPAKSVPRKAAKVAAKQAPAGPAKVVAITKGAKGVAAATVVTLAQVARDLDMRPQTARARFRRMDDAELVKHGLLKSQGDRWTFKASARAWLVETLTG